LQDGNATKLGKVAMMTVQAILTKKPEFKYVIGRMQKAYYIFSKYLQKTSAILLAKKVDNDQTCLSTIEYYCNLVGIERIIFPSIYATI
jgi:hypothetical protein